MGTMMTSIHPWVSARAGIARAKKIINVSGSCGHISMLICKSQRVGDRRWSGGVCCEERPIAAAAAAAKSIAFVYWMADADVDESESMMKAMTDVDANDNESIDE